jgi:hypothetical protein
MTIWHDIISSRSILMHRHLSLNQGPSNVSTLDISELGEKIFTICEFEVLSVV